MTELNLADFLAGLRARGVTINHHGTGLHIGNDDKVTEEEWVRLRRDAKLVKASLGPEERAARMRREGPLSYNPSYYTEVALRDVEEKDMSTYEIMAARAAFAGRFGPQLDRWRNR